MAFRKIRWTCFSATFLFLAAPAWCDPAVPGAQEQKYTEERRMLVLEVRQLAQVTAQETGHPAISREVLAAMERTPRHRFVPDDQLRYAYHNRPLPIGHGQTISQPYLVALMTDMLQVRPGQRVFEIGTGSGYQAALLAELGINVYTIEIIEPLARTAEKTLSALYSDKVTVRHGDGYYGWEEHAPYDAIIVTAAASHVPPMLIRQLKPGGRIVIPLGSSFLVQQLVVVEKAENGRISSREVAPVKFVPLTGGH